MQKTRIGVQSSAGSSCPEVRPATIPADHPDNLLVSKYTQRPFSLVSNLVLSSFLALTYGALQVASQPINSADNGSDNGSDNVFTSLSSTRISNISFPNFVELAAVIVPQRTIDLKQRLRSGCWFLPMPLTLGWGSDTQDSEKVQAGLVPGLMLTDIGSGSTREVKASWMHTLYQHSQEQQEQGAAMAQLRDIGFNPNFGWQHVIMILVFVGQFVLAIFAIFSHHRRDGWLVLSGLLVRIGQCAFDHIYPVHASPRSVRKPRFYALHTKMTTRHLLVLAHEPSGGHDGSRRIYQLEDASYPVRRHSPKGLHAGIERTFCEVLRLTGWLQKAFCVLTQSSGFWFSSILLLGTAAMEVLWAVEESGKYCKPSYTRMELDTGPNVLDMLTSVCQATGVISMGFVEEIFPDPMGNHANFNLIKNRCGLEVQQHPIHATGNQGISAREKEATQRRQPKGGEP